MKAIYFVFCLCTALMFSTVNSLAAGEDFKTFLRKFTSSASFQYSRITVSYTHLTLPTT